MMRTLLVPLAEGIAGEPALDAALLFARRLKSHIRAVWARPDPNLVLSFLPDGFAASGVTREAIEREGLAAANAARSRFDAWQAEHEIAGAPENNRLDACFASWSDPVGEIETLVTRLGRVSDMIVLGRFAAGEVTPARLFDAAVFGAGRPTLLAPRTLPWDPLDHVLIAWNGSLESSRTVFAAMPLLRAARRVSIFAAAEHGSEAASAGELAESLVWHGIHAGPLAIAGAHPPGPALLEAAKRREATLIVMGAYTHSRLRQAFLGGVTSRVLAHAEIPVLLSH
jgi:nucleotide-binding universal stress UspA family protein